VAFAISRRTDTGAEVGVCQLFDDLGAGRPGALVVSVDVIEAHGNGVAQSGPGRARTDDVAGKGELRPGYAAVFPRDFETLLEPEGSGQPGEGSGGVVVALDDEQVWWSGHGSSFSRSAPG
jgi:hypothetical protein